MGQKIVDLNSLSDQQMNSLKKDVNRQLRTGCKRGSAGRNISLDEAKELLHQKERIEALQVARGISLMQSVHPELSEEAPSLEEDAAEEIRDDTEVIHNDESGGSSTEKCHVCGH